LHGTPSDDTGKTNTTNMDNKSDWSVISPNLPGFQHILTRQTENQ